MLLYPLLGFAVYPRKRRAADAPGATRQAGDDGLLSRKYLRYILAGFWIFGALLQLQPNWWQPGQISQTISGYIGMGGLNTWLVDPVLTQLSHASANIEIPLNIALIVVFLALGIGLAVVKREQLPPLLVASIVVSLVFWYFSQAFGGILTGMATDFNSGLLVVVMALAVWPHLGASQAESAHTRLARQVRGASQVSQEEGSGSTQHA